MINLLKEQDIYIYGVNEKWVIIRLTMKILEFIIFLMVYEKSFFKTLLIVN